MTKREIKAVFAVTGTYPELEAFEKFLDSKGISEILSNPTASKLGFKWIVVYSDHAPDGSDSRPSYAYRSTNCKHTSKPAVITISTATKRLESGYYFKDGKYLNFIRRKLELIK